jgi:hypothetical protein
VTNSRTRSRAARHAPPIAIREYRARDLAKGWGYTCWSYRWATGSERCCYFPGSNILAGRPSKRPRCAPRCVGEVCGRSPRSPLGRSDVPPYLLRGMTPFGHTRARAGTRPQPIRAFNCRCARWRCRSCAWPGQSGTAVVRGKVGYVGVGRLWRGEVVVGGSGDCGERSCFGPSDGKAPPIGEACDVGGIRGAPGDTGRIIDAATCRLSRRPLPSSAGRPVAWIRAAQHPCG